MSALTIKLKTIYALGISNVLWVLCYRTRLKLMPSRKPSLIPIHEPFFFSVKNHKTLPFVPTTDWHTKANYFGWLELSINNQPPLWHQNPINGYVCDSRQPWWRLSDFDSSRGDIKVIWEASRFTWVLAFCERYLSGADNELITLNDWLLDWAKNNPIYYGVNWKCGQEASIRVLHLAMAALLLGQTEATSKTLLNFIYIHLKRISHTIRYAISQNNNHATSEAAALFIGGNWLSRNGIVCGKRWEKIGRRWLEKLAVKLIADDGSFSQYSVNYHRVMLDTMSMVEIWRQQCLLPNFSSQWQSKVRLATKWLEHFVDPITGRAANIGANDSAYLFPLGQNSLNDFRLSVQTASVLFNKECIYSQTGPWNNRLQAFNIALPNISCRYLTKQFDNGGYAVLNNQLAKVILRYPRFKFRPSQADALHVDFWHNGHNILRDAGSYSYNATIDELNYFSGTKGHNTVQFDSRDQMPRLSRFLFGTWLKTKVVENVVPMSFAASYNDAYGAYHKRKIILSLNKLFVIDDVTNFCNEATLRWRLLPVEWTLHSNVLSSEIGTLTINATMPIEKIILTTGWESLFYLQKTSVPILEITFKIPGQITSIYNWIS